LIVWLKFVGKCSMEHGVDVVIQEAQGPSSLSLGSVVVLFGAPD